MGKKYQRITEDMRDKVAGWLKDGRTKSAIAKELGYNRSSIGREVTRNNDERGSEYRACLAQRKADVRRGTQRKKIKLATNPKLLEYVIEKTTRFQWSPEQIASRIKHEYPNDKSMRISHEAIYQYAYILPRGALKKQLLSALRRPRKGRRSRQQRPDNRGKIKDMLSIENRPQEINTRTVAGHWEGDLIVGKDNRSAMGTLVERKSRYLLLVRLKDHQATTVRKAFEKAFNKLPQTLKQSMTYDQGKEMSQHKKLTEATNTIVYFCHPHSPWERPSNENMNGLLRQYFPKKMDLNTVSLAETRRVQKLLNGRPRRVLEWATPEESFSQLVALAN